MTDTAQIILNMQGKRILIVGDVMLDVGISGEVKRISPEAPVPILLSQQETHCPGGAANVARNLAHCGVSATLIGVVGGDNHASVLKHSLKHGGNITFHALKNPRGKTTVKTRLTAQGQQILRVDDEDTTPITPQMEAKIIDAVHKAFAKTDAIILSDYDKGVITEATAHAIITLGVKAGIPVLVDPKKPDAALYAGARLITPNLAEMARLLGKPHSDFDSIGADSKKLLAKHKIDSALITMGAEGMMLVERGNRPQKTDSHARAVFDVSGAGDTVVAMMAAGLAAGANMGEAMELANTAAGIVVSKSGTAVVTPGEILGEINVLPQAGREAGTQAVAKTADMSLDSVLEKTHQWKHQGLTIGFTNGCFDCLHPGHLGVLAAAKTHCDRLIVAVNSDASTRLLKGRNRPHQTLQKRIAALTQLPMVDCVVVFDAKTPAKLIQRLKPHRLIKGGDYTAKSVIGYKTVTDSGGQVIIIPSIKNYSTSQMQG